MTFTADDIAPASSEAQPALPEDEPPPPLPPKKTAAEAAQDFRELLAEKVVHAAACRSPLALRCVSWPLHTRHTREYTPQDWLSLGPAYSGALLPACDDLVWFYAHEGTSFPEITSRINLSYSHKLPCRAIMFSIAGVVGAQHMHACT